MHVYLGDFLLMQGRLDEATAAYTDAKQRIPANSQLHDHLGNALFQQGKLDQAIAEYREAIRLAPGFADARTHLAQALINQGNLDPGIQTYREAIALAPRFPAPHVGLGAGLRRRGDFTQAAAELRAAFELATDPVSRETIQQELTRTERWQDLAKRSPDEERRDDLSGSPAETLDRAYYCYERQHHGRAARLFNRVPDQDPGLIGELNHQNRYNAACACVLAAASQASDAPPPSEADKTYFRQRARDYLKADLTRWLNLLGNGSQPTAIAIRQTLEHWKADPDLFSVRASQRPAEHARTRAKGMDQALGNGRCCAQAAFAIARRLSGEVRRSDIHPFRRGNTLRTAFQFCLYTRPPAHRPGNRLFPSGVKHIIALHGCYDGKTNEGYKIPARISRKRSKTNKTGQSFDSGGVPLFRLISRADTDFRGEHRRCVLE